MPTLAEQIEDALQEGWSQDDDGPYFSDDLGRAAVLKVPIIAAAPDLLSACQRAERLLVQREGNDALVESALVQIRDAIAKAEV